MAKLKIASVAILAALLAIVIVQNTESVETKLWFWTLSMPRAALLFLHVLVGFVIGLLTVYSLRGKKSGS